MGWGRGRMKHTGSLSLVPPSPSVRTMSLSENRVPWKSEDIFLIPSPLLISSPALCFWGKTAAVQCGPWAAEDPINTVLDWHVHAQKPLWRQATWQLLKGCSHLWGWALSVRNWWKKKKAMVKFGKDIRDWWSLSLSYIFAQWILQNGRRLI